MIQNAYRMTNLKDVTTGFACFSIMYHKLKEDRERLIAAVAKAENWPINKEMVIKKHYKAFAKFTKQIDKIKEMN